MSELKDAWMALESHWKITPKDARITGDASYGFMRWTLAPLFRMLLRVKIRGIANVPKSGPTILAANHLSHVDPLVVILASRRRTHYLAKDGHFRNFALRTFMRATGQIETNRETGGAEALSSAAVVLHARRALGIFPEGTVPGLEVELAPFKHGAFTMAIEHQVPIVPMTFLDNKKRFPWSFGGLIGGSKGTPGILRVKIHEPIETKGMVKEDRVKLSEDVRKLMLDDLRNS